jgi:MSHA biogenesis protein MshK
MSGRKLIMMVAVAMSSVAAAQGLPDPTRPPAALESAPAAMAAPAASGLQSVLRRQGMKPAAVIHGTYVELGGQVGDARLVAVGEDSVTLQSDSGRETLWLTPGIEKRSVATAGNDGGEKRRQVPPRAGERKKTP